MSLLRQTRLISFLVWLLYFLQSECSENKYSDTTFEWSFSPQKLPKPKASAAIGVWNNRLYMIGGSTTDVGHYDPTIYSIDFDDLLYSDNVSDWTYHGDWQTDASYGAVDRITCPRCDTQVDELLYIVTPGREYGNMLIYNMSSESQVSGSEYDYSSLVSDMEYACSVNNGTHIFAIGGVNPGDHTYDTLQIYDIELDVWSYGSSMSIERSYIDCEFISQTNLIYVFGGYTIDSSQSALSSIEVYDVAGDTWTLLNSPSLTFPSAWVPVIVIYNNDNDDIIFGAIGGRVYNGSTWRYENITNIFYYSSNSSENDNYLENVTYTHSKNQVPLDLGFPIRNSAIYPLTNTSFILLGGIELNRTDQIESQTDAITIVTVDLIPTPMPTTMPTSVPTDNTNSPSMILVWYLISLHHYSVFILQHVLVVFMVILMI